MVVNRSATEEERILTQRVAAYVDGFNLYYGLRAKGWRRYYWLDLVRLAENLLRPGQQLAAVRYFTAGVFAEAGDPDKPLRQNTYLDALATLPALRIHMGYHVAKQLRCPSCGASWQTYEEKMTDVNIAVELLGDAQDDLFDTAIIISGDGDLASPVRTVRERYPGKQAIVAFPPGRHSDGLRSVATASFPIGRGILSKSLLPDQVIRADGFVLKRPPTWI